MRLMCDRAYRITGFGCTGEVCTNSRGEKGQCAVLERLAMVEGRKVHIIHGINISQKELIYLLQKSRSYQSKVLRACS